MSVLCPQDLEHAWYTAGSLPVPGTQNQVKSPKDRSRGLPQGLPRLQIGLSSGTRVPEAQL